MFETYKGRGLEPPKGPEGVHLAAKLDLPLLMAVKYGAALEADAHRHLPVQSATSGEDAFRRAYLRLGEAADHLAALMARANPRPWPASEGGK